ncbi:MAG TPA: biotin-dependent carboxyltransferase family protein [Thermoanaerobaculia bacterium]|nr:biotin-dependent carboxyltransferase family protein [Thermoanaerobaculia bacterium]
MRIVRTGLLATVQDEGRRGAGRWGVPTSGFADAFCAAAANWLAGNAPGAALIEATLGPLELEATEATAAGVAGATAAASVNGGPVDRAATIFLRPGDRLAIGAATAGLRFYVAVHGGVAVPTVLGSRSALLPSALPGFAGRKLAPDDDLPIGESAPVAPRRLAIGGLLPFPTAEVRAIAGPQWDAFPAESRRRFFGEPFRVSPRSDRRGVRLEGGAVPPSSGEIAPEGVVVGSVQVPSGGEPIVLMPDGPVTGGYPKIAVVVRADLPVLGQLRPGEMVRFREVSRAEAAAAFAARRAALGETWPA